MTPPPDASADELTPPDAGGPLGPPPWLWTFLGLLLAVMALLMWRYLPRDVPAAGTTGTVDVTSEARGALLYSASCASCHQPDGRGQGNLYPSLAGSPWTVGDEERLAKLVLHGLSGEVTVHGVTYNGAMPAWRHLNDEQLATILTYVRAHFGNDAPPVQPETVARVRAATQDRTAPYRPEELE